MLREAEREQVVEEWNRTEGEYGAGAGVCASCLRSRRRRTPEAVAVVCGGGAGELWGVEPASEPAGAAISGGREWGRRVRVGVCVERSGGDGGGAAGDLEGGRSVCAAGSGVIRTERLGYMLEDSGGEVVVTEGRGDGESCRSYCARRCWTWRRNREEMEREKRRESVG